MKSESLEPTEYKHTQGARLATIILGVWLLVPIANFVDELRRGNRFPWWCLPGMAIIGSLLYFLTALTVEIGGGTLRVGFRRGWCRSVQLADVTDVEQTTIPWYHRWGPRLTARGWLYAVRGRNAVSLGLRDGRGLIIGTDEPERLAAAIESGRSTSSAS
jgi:hypothetical protein